ncbi:MAG TPA: hypothetical protein VJ831_08905 [Jatrophihabitantaceae bacterium]|nr:hypothetical protein [Jatrophihabitantaceae bacterium]
MSAALGMVLVVFGAIACLVAGALLIRRARRNPRVAFIVSSALVVGGAAFLVALVVSGVRHFGGHRPIGGYVCAPWWVQIDSPGGLANDHITPASQCRQAALDATDTVLIQSGLVAAVWAGLVGGYLGMRRRTLAAEAGATR